PAKGACFASGIRAESTRGFQRLIGAARNCQRPRRVLQVDDLRYDAACQSKRHVLLANRHRRRIVSRAKISRQMEGAADFNAWEKRQFRMPGEMGQLHAIDIAWP